MPPLSLSLLSTTRIGKSTTKRQTIILKMADLNNLLANLEDNDGDESGHFPNYDVDTDKHNQRYESEDGDYDGKHYYNNDRVDDSSTTGSRIETQQQHLSYPDGIISVESGMMMTPYQHLTVAWKQELACPELLPYNQQLMDYFIEIVGRQEEDVIQSVKDDDTIANPMVTSISVDLLKIELNRIRFILADLLRTRIQKIEKHALYNRNVIDRMSDEEVQYLQRYGKFLESHLSRTVLNHVPRNFARLDMPEMIDMPNFDETVFCQMLESIEFRESSSTTAQQQVEEDITQDEITTPDTGTTYIARYSAIREYVLEGKVILLS